MWLWRVAALHTYVFAHVYVWFHFRTCHFCVTIGVAGVVVNEKNEFLLVQEKWLRNRSLVMWKFPGGMADLGN